MSTKSVMISCVDFQYTQEYIANVFWNQHIAKVSHITLIPYLKEGDIYNMAYITIGEWCASESAYNFIMRLNDSTKEARIVYQSDDWWPVELNTHNTGDNLVGSYTVVFNNSYFVRNNDYIDTVSTAPCSETDEDKPVPWYNVRPIKGLAHKYYSVDEANIHLSILKQVIFNLENEYHHFEKELLVYAAEKKIAKEAAENTTFSLSSPLSISTDNSVWV